MRESNSGLRLSSAQEMIRRCHPLVDKYIGVIRKVERWGPRPGTPPIYYYAAKLCDLNTLGVSPASSRFYFGAHLNWRAALAAALGEAVERYGAAIHGRDQLIWGSFRHLKDQGAIAPETFNLYSERQYRSGDFPYVRFTEETTLHWITGTSLLTGEQRLVPAQAVFLPYRFRAEEPNIFLPISTGLASGASREAAMLSGLCELIERDALVITWFNALPVPRLRADSLAEPQLTPILSWVEEHGLDLLVKVTTTDLHIPSFLALLIDRHGRQPITVAGSAAHPDPQIGAIKAIIEVIMVYLSFVELIQARQFPVEAPARYEDITGLASRGVFYALHDSRENLSFLQSGPRISLEDLEPYQNAGPACDLNYCREHLAHSGIDAVAVDITPRDLQSLGLYVYRVVAPGLQQMEADHRYRLLGGARLYHVPQRLGYSAHPTREETLFSLPHPLA